MKAVKVTEETAREFCYFFKHMYKKTNFFSFSHDLLDLKLLITHDPLIDFKSVQIYNHCFKSKDHVIIIFFKL